MNYREQFESLNGEPYLKAVNLVGFKEYCAKYGCDALQLMDEVGIPRKALDDLDSLVSFRSTVVMMELLSSRYNLPNLGLEISAAGAPDYPALGPSILIANFVKTMREWTLLAIRYWQFHTNGFKLELIEHEQEEFALIRIHFQAMAFPARQYIEASVANIIGVAKVVADSPEENPLVVRFQHREPKDISFHHNFFNCPVEFNCEHVEIAFHKRALDYETKGGMRVFKPLMELYIRERIRRMRLFDYSMSSTVALAITSMLGFGHCGQEQVAKSLHINVKNMQRQLGKEGTTFSELLDNVRHRIARQLLIETDAAVSQIAGLLDYASAGPFIVAFQRWEHTSPLQFRKQQRELMATAIAHNQS